MYLWMLDSDAVACMNSRYCIERHVIIVTYPYNVGIPDSAAPAVADSSATCSQCAAPAHCGRCKKLKRC